METQFNLNKEISFKPETLLEGLNLNIQISNKEHKGLAVIHGHPGKRRVFQTYVHTNPQMAIKYLKFISENPYIRYIKWDALKQKFAPAS